MDVVTQQAGQVAALYDQAETALIALITARLRRGLDAPGWAVARLAEIATVRADAARIVNRLATDGSTALRAAVLAGYRSGDQDAIADTAKLTTGTAAERPRVLTRRRGHDAAGLQALADAAVSELRPVHTAILPQVEQAYRDTINRAAGLALTRAMTPRQAAQTAWSALTDKGVIGYRDRAGRRWQLHTWVEMAVRTAVARARVQGAIDQYVHHGIRLVTVPDRPRECPRCRPWEGTVLALWGATGAVTEPHTITGKPTTVRVAGTLDQARAAGLLHPACRHTIRAYRPGRSRPRATADAAGYQAEQQQRYLERQLRTWRVREASALTAQGQHTAATRVAAWNQALTEHLAQHPGLRRVRYRERPGAGHTT